MSEPTYDDREALDQANETDEAAGHRGKVPGEDGGPVDEQDMAAAEGLAASADTARNYEEMLERGAHQEGEGRVP